MGKKGTTLPSDPTPELNREETAINLQLLFDRRRFFMFDRSGNQDEARIFPIPLGERLSLIGERNGLTQSPSKTDNQAIITTTIEPITNNNPFQNSLRNSVSERETSSEGSRISNGSFIEDSGDIDALLDSDSDSDSDSRSELEEEEVNSAFSPLIAYSTLGGYEDAMNRKRKQPTVNNSDEENVAFEPSGSIIKPSRKKKIRKSVNILRSIIPGGVIGGGEQKKNIDASVVLDEAIKYVKFLQQKVTNLEALKGEIIL